MFWVLPGDIFWLGLGDIAVSYPYDTTSLLFLSVYNVQLVYPANVRERMGKEEKIRNRREHLRGMCKGRTRQGGVWGPTLWLSGRGREPTNKGLYLEVMTAI